MKGTRISNHPAAVQMLKDRMILPNEYHLRRANLSKLLADLSVHMLPQHGTASLPPPALLVGDKGVFTMGDFGPLSRQVGIPSCRQLQP